MLRSPLLKRKRIAWEKRERESAVPPTVVLRKFLQVSARRGANRHDDCWSVVGMWEGTPYFGEPPGRAQPRPDT